MDPATVIVASALSSSVIDLLRRLRVDRDGEQSGFRIRYVADDETRAALESLPAETREAIEDVARDANATMAGGGANPVPKEPRVVDSVEAGAALTLAPQLFRDARSRISIMFRFRLGLAVLMTVILVAALAACITSVFIGEGQWAVLFGGMTLIDVLGFAFGKPLKAVTDAVVASQRLELLHLRVQLDIAACSEVTNPEVRLARQSDLWISIQSELAAMSAG